MVFIGYTRGGGLAFFEKVSFWKVFLSVTYLNQNLPVWTGFYLFAPDSACLNRILPVCTGFYLFAPDSTCLNWILRVWTGFYLFAPDSTCLNRILCVWTGYYLFEPDTTCLNRINEFDRPHHQSSEHSNQTESRHT